VLGKDTHTHRYVKRNTTITHGGGFGAKRTHTHTRTHYIKRDTTITRETTPLHTHAVEEQVLYKSRTESWNDQPMWSFASGLCCYLAARSRPSTACAEEAHASVVGSAFVAPRCSCRRSPGMLLAPLLLSSSAVESIEAHCCLRRRHPCVHCAEDAHASIVGSAVKATCCSRTSRRRSVVDYLATI